MAAFVWTDRTLEAATKHGVEPADSEYVVNHARPPWPERPEQKVWRVWGRTASGEYLEVIYRVIDESTNLDYSQVDLLALDAGECFAIFHARPLTAQEKTQFRKRTR